MLNYDKDEMLKRLSALPHQGRIAFIAICVQRMMPLYEEYYRRSGDGSPESVKNGLDIVWSIVRGEPISKNHILNTLHHTKKLALDEDIYPDAIGNDVVFGVCYGLECGMTGDVKLSEYPARMAFDLLYQYIYSKNNPGLSTMTSKEVERTIADPLIQVELQRQRRDILELTKISQQNGNYSENADNLRKQAISEDFSVIATNWPRYSKD